MSPERKAEALAKVMVNWHLMTEYAQHLRVSEAGYKELEALANAMERAVMCMRNIETSVQGEQDA